MKKKTFTLEDWNEYERTAGTEKFIYVCGTDWRHEIGETNVLTYARADCLKKPKSCWQGCGIVKLRVTCAEWVEPEDDSKRFTQPKDEEVGT